MKRTLSLILVLSMLLALLCGCMGGTVTEDTLPDADEPAVDTLAPAGDDTNAQEETQSDPEPVTPPAPQKAEYTIKSAIYREGDTIPEGYTTYSGVVEHLFFHPVIAYPEVAFSSYQAEGLDDWMVTVGEYVKILESVYEKGFVLVDINDIWSEETAEDGTRRMVKNTLLVPEGKRPLVFSYDDVNYYQYMIETGFTHKLILGDDGLIWSYGLDPDGKEVISQDLDAVTILDKFVREHPDFSPFGAKGCLSLTGFEGILGYRTQTDRDNTSAEFEAARQKEITAVKPIVEELKRTGWTFGCHTWGHINLDRVGMSTITDDLTRWTEEVGSLIGETSVIFYPHGARPDGNDWKNTGEEFRYLHSLGYRVFCSVGINSFSYIKDDIGAVICDRLHPDGTTLRSAKSLERYAQFYDAREIIDLESRPVREVGWMS